MAFFFQAHIWWLVLGFTSGGLILPGSHLVARARVHILWPSSAFHISWLALRFTTGGLLPAHQTSHLVACARASPMVIFSQVTLWWPPSRLQASYLGLPGFTSGGLKLCFNFKFRTMFFLRFYHHHIWLLCQTYQTSLDPSLWVLLLVVLSS